MSVGVRRAAAAWRRGRLDTAGRAAVLLLAVGWGQLLVTATVHKAIPRYLLVGVALLVVLAGAEAWAWLRYSRASRAWRRDVIIVGVGLLAAHAAAGMPHASLNREGQTTRLEPLRTAATTLDGEQPCAVATGRVPQ